MPHLSISCEEAAVLRQLLEAARVDLVREISHTDSREFRGALKQRGEIVERLLTMLAEQTELTGQPV